MHNNDANEWTKDDTLPFYTILPTFSHLRRSICIWCFCLVSFFDSSVCLTTCCFVVISTFYQRTTYTFYSMFSLFFRIPFWLVHSPSLFGVCVSTVWIAPETARPCSTKFNLIFLINLKHLKYMQQQQFTSHKVGKRARLQLCCI